MENVSLKKKLSTFVSKNGRLRNVSEEVLYEVLRSWEDWTGTAREFYRSLGFSQKQMAKLLGKAKKLKRDGHFGSEVFKELRVETSPALNPHDAHGKIELVWEGGKVIRFPGVNSLLEFIKKAS